MSRRALVTGATGGLGRTLVPALVAAGYEVIATGRDAAAGAALEQDGAKFIAADLRDSSVDVLRGGADVVFHLAALSSPWGRWSDFAAINVSATRRLLDAARRRGCGAFVHASTPSIYVEARDRLGLTEQSPTARRFANHYAATKFEAERIVLAANESDFRTIAIRPRAIVGPHDAVLLPRLIRASRGGRMPVPNAGNALIELTDVRDAAAAFIAADAARERAGGRAFNISGGQPRALRDLLLAIFAAIGTTPRLVSLPAGPAMAAAWLAERVSVMLPGRPEPPATRYTIMALGFSQTFDLAAARQMLGWSPHISPEAAIAFALGRRPADG